MIRTFKNTNMKKIISLFISLAFLCGIAPVQAAETQYDYYIQEFVVSAYYSPLPGQARYMRGTYEGDIRLNGRGTNGADGTEVFMGMLAAPKSYRFGTKIDLPGLGMGSVHDRGGAIIAKSNYHRIDVWMGHGDRGLSRALHWGMRNITGKVYFEKNKTVTLDYTSVPAPLPKIKTQPSINLILKKNLAEGDLGTDIVTLKSILNDLGYYTGETKNNYFTPELTQSVIRFQKDQKLIATATSYGAGHVGLQTRTALTKVLSNDKNIKQTPAQKQEKQNLVISGAIGKNSSSQDIKLLQSMMKSLGYYNEKTDGVFSQELIAAIFAFQKEQNILSSWDEAGAGNFGPKTQAALKSVIQKRKDIVKNYPKTKSEMVIGEIITKKVKTNIITRVEPNYPVAKSQIFHTSFAIGDKGSEVKELQNTLVTYGLLDQKYATGYFGNITKSALKKAKTNI